MSRRTRMVGGSALMTAIALVGAGAFAAPSSAAPARTTLNGSRPAWARSSSLKKAAPSSDWVNIRVYLNWRNQSEAAATALAVSTPGSSSHGKFLTPAQFKQRFAPSQSDVVAVQQFLRHAGFSVVETADDNQYVAAEGTVAQAQSAFSTKLGEYTVDGRVLRAPESAVSVPSSLGSTVQAVVGLDQGAALLAPTRSAGDSPKQNHGAPGIGFRAGEPCSLWWGEKTVSTPNAPAYGTTTKPFAPCGYTPMQVRGLYGLSATDTGAGQTVAFVGANASPTLVDDVATYSRNHNLPAPSITEQVPPGVYKHPDTPQQVPGDYYGEETLDAEAIHTTAPGAKLLYVASSNAYQDFDRSVKRIVTKRLASIISISYGFSGENVPQGYVNSLNNTFMEAAATGIGVYVSSGDNGDEASTFGSPQVDFYADSPFVTAVGGTSAAIVPSGTAPAGLDYGSAKDPKSALNQPGWQRDFEVGWQTGLDPISSTSTDHLSSAPYVLNGKLEEPLPGEFYGGGGGGVSTIFAEPSYQTPAIGARGGRAVPDISALADPNTGFLVGQTQQFTDGTYYDEYRIGGTSLAAPLMAGMAAVLNQHNGGKALGFLNPTIYAAYSASGSTAYYDVDQADLFGRTTSDPLPSVVRINYANSENAKGGLTASLRTLEEPDQSLHSVKGYDDATGVGTPNGGAFFDGLVRAQTK
ncbi:S53 family peptidase [Amnibacterium endophyticum]|uniref:Protease pro-enzyme activation domain-containing protein n=1 Tax=Amnibacterium endophyticum TaxID=2109337 RepID=A0ABW4LB49_9MICO